MGEIRKELAEWVADLDDRTHGKLARTGLLIPREHLNPTLQSLLDHYFDTLVVKESTRTAYKQARDELEEHFGPDRRLSQITNLEAGCWRQHLIAVKYAPATVAKFVRIARQIFKRGVRWRMISASPFDGIKAGSQRNPDRLVFVPRGLIEAVLAACSSPEWRAMIALSRYGALRVPSEVLALKWDHIDWERGRITVPCPKTAGHAGRESRVIPMFPELKPHLLSAFSAAPDGAEYVIAKYRDAGTNLRTEFERLIARAGAQAWPRLWQNLRASRATELAQENAGHVAAAWCGHTEAIAMGHYRQVRDEDFERAINGGQKAAQNPAHSGQAQPHTDQPNGQESESDGGEKVPSVKADATHARRCAMRGPSAQTSKQWAQQDSNL